MSINITMLAPGFVGNTFYNTGATADVADADAVAAISSRIARYTTAPLLSQVASTEALLSSFEGLSSSKKEEFRDALGITGGGGGDSSSIVVEQAQTAHGLTVGKPVTRDASGNFILAVANDTQVKAAAVGVVSAVADANNLTVTLYGPIDSGLSGLTAPGLYYVANDGSLTLDTNNATNWVVPILFATSATSGYVLPQSPQSKALIPLAAISGFSTDGTFASNSDAKISSEKAIKTYVDGKVAVVPTNAISASAIDWSLGPSHSKTLSANTTFTFSNALDGQTINVAVTNTAGNYTVTWPTVKWSGGSAPTQTTGAKTDVYTFIKVGSTIYGNVSANHS